MATPHTFIRDWVFTVIKPFLSQLKNRLANIKISYDYNTNSIRFYNAENILSNLSIDPIPYSTIQTIHPRRASKHLYGHDLEGYMVVMLPEGISQNIMMSVFIDVYLYKSNKAFSFVLSGYTYQAPHWYNITARQIANVPSEYDRVKFVRFLKTGGDEDEDADYTRFGFIIGDNEDIAVPYFTLTVSKILVSHQTNPNLVKQLDADWYIDIHSDDDMPVYKKDYTKVM